MLIYIDMGHNARSKDIGSPGVRLEDELTKIVSLKLTDFLKRNSDYKILCPNPSPCNNINDSLRSRASAANSANADLFVSIHFNAFNQKANGAEVFVNREGSSATPIAQRILNKIVALGFKNRGVKSANFAVLHLTKMKAILVECCFCDSEEDMRIFDADKMAEAIAEGILDKDIPPAGDVDPHPQPAMLKVMHQTFLKPSTADTSTMNSADKARLNEIKPGSYKIDLLADEEGHYLINLNGAKGFIYSGHCLAPTSYES